jgi:hypothetical protein
LVIDPDREQLIRPEDVCGLIPGRGGRRVSVATVKRWMKRRGGPRLESLMIGGLRFTSREAVRRFIVAQNPELERLENQERRTRAALRAEHELRAEGL